MSDWRSNPNLVECFDNCVAMFRGSKAVRPPPPSDRERWAQEIKTRRLALGLSQLQLAEASGCRENYVSIFERVYSTSADRYRQLSTTLDRLETERQAEAAE